MKRFISLFVSILLSAVALTWFAQNSINAYWQQTYHENSPLEPLSEYAWWCIGADWQQKAYEFSDGLKASLEAEDALVSEDSGIETTGPSENTENIETSDNQKETAASDATNNTDAAASEPSNQADQSTTQVVLKKGNKVFFAGDSLMQGVAPFVQKHLKQEYGVQSVNLSKQSTGLSYPNFFDWPKTIEQTLQKEPDIRVLVVFLGPNDPWDFPMGKKYLKFASPEWEAEYLNRVRRILDAASTHDVQVIWLGIPYMKKTKLNEQMRYLDKILSGTVSPQAIWLPTDKLLSNGAEEYADSVKVNGKIIRYRSKDGIHFSAEGQKLLAEKIMEKINFTHDTQP